MGGLLAKAKAFLERDSGSGSGTAETVIPRLSKNGLFAKAAAFLEKARFSGSDSVSARIAIEKEKEVMAELDSILEKNRLEINENTLDFNPQSSDMIFPLATNLTAVLILIFLGIFFYFTFDQNEESLVSPERRITSREGLIVETVRKSAEEEISRKETEIESVRIRLQEAENDRAALIADTENEILRREAELKKVLEEELVAERLRLQQAGLSQVDIDRRLAEFETGKQQEYDDKLASAKKELDMQLENKSRELTDKMSQYRLSLDKSQAEIDLLKNTMEDRLAAAELEAEALKKKAEEDEQNYQLKLAGLKEQQEEINIIESRIMSMYASVNSFLEKGDYTAAGEQLGLLEDFINSPLTVRLTEQSASSAERREIDRILTDTMRRIINLEITAKTPSQPVNLRMELSEDEKDLLRRAQSADIRRDTLIRELGNLQSRYKNAPESDKSSSLKIMIKLLNSKLLIRQALASEEVLKKYPELYKTADEIFELYGKEQREAGRNEALQDIVAITDYLNSRRNNSSPPPGDAAMEARQRELLIDFLENLQKLLDEPADR